MFQPLEELIRAYFARTWPIAACENQLDVNGGLIPTLRMGASRHQIPHRLQAHDPWLWLFASRSRILPPKPKALKYPTNHIRVLDQSDDQHLRAASWADQRINLPNLFDKLPPGLVLCLRRLVIRYVQYGEISAILFFGWFISRSQHSLLTPLPFCPV